jgi:transposase
MAQKYKIADVIKDYQNGESMTEIKNRYGIANPYFKRILEENGITYEPRNPRNLNNLKKIPNILEDYKNGLSMRQIRLKNNVWDVFIKKVLTENGLTLEKRHPKNDKNLNKIPNALEDYKNGKSINYIYETYGISNSFFKKILKENNLEYIDRAKNPSSGDFATISENLSDILMAYEQNKNIRKTAKTFNVHEANLRDFLRNKELIGITNLPIDWAFLETKKEEIYDLYINKYLNYPQISKIVGIPRHQIGQILTKFYGKSILREPVDVVRNMNYTIEHQMKSLKGSYKKKSYTLPSGKVIKLQGYEDDFLDYTFKHSILTEDDFNFNKPFRVVLTPRKKAKHKHYYPDFYIKKYNMVIEIKSRYIFNLNIYLNKRKIRKTKDAGHNIIMIFDKKYQKYHKFLKSRNLLKK